MMGEKKFNLPRPDDFSLSVMKTSFFSILELFPWFTLLLFSNKENKM